MIYSIKGKKVWVAGHAGMVGKAIVRRLNTEECKIISCDRKQIDLRRQHEVELWVKKHKPDAIIIAAATVGGIKANDNNPAKFLYDNLMIEANIIHSAHTENVSKLMMLGSSCIYPKYAPQPICENDMLSGPLEKTNQWYSIAKISGVMLCQAYREEYGNDFISVMPTNLYGPGDLFNEKNSHVIPALLMRFDEAKVTGQKSVTVWGSGNPRREFLYSDDLADAVIHSLKNYSDFEPLNIGCGKDISIADLSKIIAGVVGFKGKILFDSSMPDGTPRKLLNSERLSQIGWKPKITLQEGLLKTFLWYKKVQSEGLLRVK
ncbi:MAG: GDP-fucose synthetase [Rhodospirillaceae bacterium]|nr:GDP-fucose synthetase [Rhodospirillaceae bacterium]|tara:strand:+ start:7379 stop:8335 length:957 start_codon:yes stop_codon:yes gene_type:complete